MKACLLEERKVSRWGLKEVGITYVVSGSFNLVNQKDWESVVLGKNIFLSQAYLKAIDLGHPDSLSFVIFYKENDPVGVAVFHEIYFISGELKSHVNSKGGADIVGKTFKNEASRYSVLVCGNPHCTGEHGFKFIDSIQPEIYMQALCAVASSLAYRMRAKNKRATGIIVKDFYPKNYNALNELKKCGFHVFSVDQQNRMLIPPRWRNFEDYTSDLNTKFRTKVKSVMAKSSELNVLELSLEDMQRNSQLLFSLYRNVYDRADFAMEPMTMDFFLHLKAQLKSQMIVKALKFEDSIVAFQIAVLNGEELEAFAVGINYDVNLDLSLYGRMLLEFIKMAIEFECKSIAFGRTAGEIKSTFGAFPVEMKVAARHPGYFRNIMLKPFFKNVHPAIEPQREPFKGELSKEVQREQMNWNNGINE